MRVSASRELGRPLGAPARRPPPPALAPARRAPAGHPRAPRTALRGRRGRASAAAGRLVRRRAPGLVLLERERDVSAVVELVADGREGPRQNARSVWCRFGDRITHPLTRPVARSSLPRLADGAPIGRAVRVALAAGLDRRPTSRTEPPGPAVDHALLSPGFHGGSHQPGRLLGRCAAPDRTSRRPGAGRDARRGGLRLPHVPIPATSRWSEGIADLAAAAGEDGGSRPSDRGPAGARGCRSEPA